MTHMISTKEAATRANVNPRTVRKWVAASAVKGVKVSGKIMVDPVSLDKRLDRTDVDMYARKSTTDLIEIVKGERVNARRVSERTMMALATLVATANVKGVFNLDNSDGIDRVRAWANTSIRTPYKADPFNFDPNGELTPKTNVWRRMNAVDGLTASEIVRTIEDGLKVKAGINMRVEPSIRAMMEDVLPTGNGSQTSKPKGVKLASAKQCATVRNVWAKKDVALVGEELAIATLAVVWAEYADGNGERPEKELTHNEISPIIGKIFDAPWKPRNESANAPKSGESVKALEAGFYRHPNGEIIRVKLAKSGYPFAGYVDGETYVRGLVKDVKAEWKMNIEDVKAYGRETGMCMVCSRELTNPESIAEGIGPICSGRV